MSVVVVAKDWKRVLVPMNGAINQANDIAIARYMAKRVFEIHVLQMIQLPKYCQSASTMLE